MSPAAVVDIRELLEHPAYEAYQEKITAEIERCKRALVAYEGKPGMDFQTGVIRYQEMIRAMEWVRDRLPQELTTPSSPVQSGLEGMWSGDDPYAASEENPITD